MAQITNIDPRIILDSRQAKTIEVTITSGDIKVSAAVPSGKSKGEHEAYSVAVEEALELITQLATQVGHQDFASLAEFDQFLIKSDGTENKHHLGANTTLALSFAFARVLAETQNKPLYQILGEAAEVSTPKFPKLFCNLINGGLHVNPEYHPLPFQEYMVIPQSESPSESLKLTQTFIDHLRNRLKEHQEEINLGDEGGFIISGNDPELGLKLMQDILEEMGTDKFKIAIDVASTSLYETGSDRYIWQGKGWSPEELEAKYLQYIDQYPIFSIEDPFAEDSWSQWSSFYAKAHDKIWIVGDDLTVTNLKRINEAENQKTASAIIIKPNQIGTVTETLEAIKLAKSYGWKIIVSHRSGETMDTFIADLAYGVGADGLKSGSPLQKERLVKYQRLIEIEKEV